MLALYGIAFVASIIELFVLLKDGQKNHNVCQILLFVATIMGNMGYLALALAKETETALLANRIVYLGSVFMPFFIMLTIADLCEVEIPALLNAFLTIWSFVVLALCFSMGYSTIYYRSVTLQQAYGVSYLVKEYGPAHNLYTFLLLTEVLMCFGIIIKTMLSEKSFSRKTAWQLLIAVTLTTLVYGGEKIIHTKVTCLPIAYILSTVIYLYVCKRIKVYDMSAVLLNTYEQKEEFGYITFDTKLRYMNCNALARKIFPELKSMQVDEPITDESMQVYQKIVLLLEKFIETKKEKSIIVVGERHLDCDIDLLYGGFFNKVIGYSIEMEDVTRQQKYIELLNNYNTELESEVRKKTRYMNAMQEAFVTGMASMAESRDNDAAIMEAVLQEMKKGETDADTSVSLF